MLIETRDRAEKLRWVSGSVLPALILLLAVAYLPIVYAVALGFYHKTAFDPSAASGPSEKDLKSAWFGQVFSDAIRTDFPRIGMLNWFEWRKQEAEVGRAIDWRLASDPALARSLLDSAPSGWLRFAGE